MLVSNTSTLVLLAKIKCLELFMTIAPTIEIPEQVQQEALFEESSYDALLIKKLISEEKIKVTKVDKNKVNAIMVQFRLDEGEAAAYVLFNHQRHQAILTDDGELIKLCKLQGISFLCAMAIIIRMYEQRKLSKETTLNKLKELHGIGRYSKIIYEYFINEVK